MASVWRSALHPRCYGLNLPSRGPALTAWSRVKVVTDAFYSNSCRTLPDQHVPLGNITISSCSSCLHSCLLRFANGNLAFKLLLTVQPARIPNPHMPSFWQIALFFQNNVVSYRNCSHAMNTHGMKILHSQFKYSRRVLKSTPKGIKFLDHQCCFFLLNCLFFLWGTESCVNKRKKCFQDCHSIVHESDDVFSPLNI